MLVRQKFALHSKQENIKSTCWSCSLGDIPDNFARTFPIQSKTRKNLNKRRDFHLRGHASDGLIDQPDFPSEFSFWTPRSLQTKLQTTCQCHPYADPYKGPGFSAENSSLNGVLQFLELPFSPSISTNNVPRSARARQCHHHRQHAEGIVEYISSPIEGRWHCPSSTSKLQLGIIKLQSAYDRKYGTQVQEQTAHEITPSRIEAQLEVAGTSSSYSDKMQMRSVNGVLDTAELQKSRRVINIRNEKLIMDKNFHEASNKFQRCQRFQIRRSSDNRSVTRPSNVNFLFRKRNKSPVKVLESACVNALNQNSRISVLFHSCWSKRDNAQNKLNLLSRPATAEPYLMWHVQRRFASASVVQDANSSIDACLVSSSTNDRPADIAQHGIRRHLKDWESTADRATKNSLLFDDSSSSLSRGKMTSLGQDEEITTEPDHEDDLEFEGMHEASTKSLVDALMPQSVLRPGDLININIHIESITAIVIGNTSGTIISYSERGTWHTLRPMQVQFSIPNVVPSDLVSDLAKYILQAEGNIEDTRMTESLPNLPRDAGWALLAKMAQFRRASDAVFRRYADRISRAYDVLSHDKSIFPSFITLEDAALILLEKKELSDLTPPMLLVVHRTLTHTQNIVQDFRNHRIYPSFVILPRMTSTRFKLVHKWVREFQDEKTRSISEQSPSNKRRKPTCSNNPLARFAAKACRVISSSRKNRPLSPIGSIGPSLAKSDPTEKRIALASAFEENQEHFDHDEQHIVGFMAAWGVSRHVPTSSPLSSVGSTVLRATGMYDEMILNRYTGILMLQEMGIVGPWDQLMFFQSHLQLPSDDLNNPATCLLNEANRSISQSVPHKDSMLGYRKSWRDSRIFCIDNEGAQVIDDGISLELIDGDENLCWVHIHVANPSAFLSKHSSVVQYARQIYETMYFPEDRFPMLDDELSKQNFSLANGRPCITFSAKISSEGEMMEKSITHGIVNGVQHLSDQDVAQALQHNRTQFDRMAEPPVLRVGTDFFSPKDQTFSPKISGKAATLDEKSTDDLRRLNEISKILKRRRLRSETLPYWKESSATLFPTVLMPLWPPNSTNGGRGKVPTTHLQNSRHFVSDPVISIYRSPKRNAEVQTLVPELMLLAGHICAMWCAERNLPIIYRGSIQDQDLLAESELEAYHKKVPDLSDGANSTDVQRRWKYHKLMYTSQIMSKPIEHDFLGLPAYCKTTSPLRRYSDLLIHWQIEAAIRHERVSGRSLVGSKPELFKDDTILPFSLPEVNKLTNWVYARERIIGDYEQRSRDHWVRLALYRAFYFHEASLPTKFEVAVRRVEKRLSRDVASGHLNDWSLFAVMTQNATSDQEGGFRDGDVWEAKLCEINPLSSAIQLHPLRLIRRTR